MIIQKLKHQREDNYLHKSKKFGKKRPTIIHDDDEVACVNKIPCPDGDWLFVSSELSTSGIGAFFSNESIASKALSFLGMILVI